MSDVTSSRSYDASNQPSPVVQPDACLWVRQTNPAIAQAAFGQTYESKEQAARRIDHTLQEVRAWLSAHQDIRITSQLPGTAQEAKQELTHIDAMLERRVAERRSSAKREREQALSAAVQMAQLETQIAQERRRVATREAEAQRRVTAERQAAAEALAQADRVAVAMARAREDATAAVVVAERASEPGRARVSRVEKEAALDATLAQANATRQKARERTAIIIAEATRDVPWCGEPEVAGIRPPPTGSFACAVAQPAPFSRVVGAMGYLAAVDWAASDATVQACTYLSAQLIPAYTKGGRYKHVAHGVLSKPDDGRRAIQCWTNDTAMRAARQYLCALGVEPDRHAVVVFTHSQQRPRLNGRVKVEEAVHILWSRVRDDGYVHTCDQAFVAAALGRARYDVAAGIDPERIAMSLSHKKPVRAGIHAVEDGSLAARFVDAHANLVVERVRLQSQEHMERLGAEGHPEPGDFAGTWTPKENYRTAPEIEKILDHLRKGD